MRISFPNYRPALAFLTLITASGCGLAFNKGEDAPADSTVATPGSATDLAFSEGTASQVFIITAEWTKPEDSGLTSQQIQFYSGASCNSALGSSVTLSSAATTASYVALSEAVYSFKVTSLYEGSDNVVSSCSSPIIVDATRPVAAWGSPTRTQMNASQSVTFPLTFTDANTITLSLSTSNLTLTQTGSLSCSSVVLGGSGNARTVTIGSCTGLGNLSVSLAAGVAVDVANNSSLALGASSTVSVDAVAPSAPTLVLLTPGSTPGNNSRPTFRVSGLTATDTITLHSNAACSSASLSSGAASGATLDLQLTNALSEGSITVYAKATDPYGNSSSCSASGATYLYDATRPAVALSAPTVAGMNSTGSSVYTATITEANGYSVSLSNGDVVLNKTGSADCSSVVVAGAGATRTITLSSCTGDGTVGITLPAATVTDSAGNTSLSASSSSQITIDNTAPTAPSALARQSPTTTPNTDSTPTIRVSGVTSGDTVAIYTSSSCTLVSQKGSATASGATVDITSSALTENSFTFYADSTDIYGNQSSCSAANVAYEYDVTAPVLASATISNSSPSASTTYNLTYGAVTGTYADYCILENSTTVASCSWTAGTLPASFVVSSTQNAKVLSVWLRDAALNVSARVDTNSVTYTPASAFSIADITFTLKNSVTNISGKNRSYTSLSLTPTIVLNAATVSTDASAASLQIYSDAACTTLIGNAASGIDAIGGVDIDVTETSYGRKEHYAILNDGGNSSACTDLGLSYFRALAGGPTHTNNNSPATALVKNGFTRRIQSAAALPNLKMLVWADRPDATNSLAELLVYDPINESAVLAGQGVGSSSPACSEEACLMLGLSSGKVLVIIKNAQAYIYNPTTDVFSSVINLGNMNFGYESRHGGQQTRAIELNNGNIFIFGYETPSSSVATAAMINPDTLSAGEFPSAPVRSNASVTLMKDGRVLIAGGYRPSGTVTDGGTGVSTYSWTTLTTANALTIFDPSDSSFTNSAVTLPVGLFGHGAALLSGSNDGNILILGGETAANTYSTSNYIYDVSDDDVYEADGGNAITPFAESSETPSSAILYRLADVQALRLPASSNQILITAGRAAFSDPTKSGNFDTVAAGRTFLVAADGKSYSALVSSATSDYDWISNILSDGRVASIQDYKVHLSTVPGGGSFALAGTNLNIPHYAHTALVTSDDKVVLLGGNTTSGGTNQKSAIYDINNSSYTSLGSYEAGNGPSFGFGAAWISSDTIVVAGGDARGSVFDISRELKTTDTFSQNGNLNPKLTTTYSTVVNSSALGVLMIGGLNGSTALDTMATYAARAWTAFPRTLATARYKHTADVVSNGGVVVIGGLASNGRGLDSIEQFEPDGSRVIGNAYPTAVVNHRTAVIGSIVYIFGGETDPGDADGSTKLHSYDTSDQRVTEGVDLGVTLTDHTMTALANGKLLIAGGRESGRASSTAYLVDVDNGTFETLTMTAARASHSATLLSDGRVLLIGGIDENEDPVNTVEVYSP